MCIVAYHKNFAKHTQVSPSVCATRVTFLGGLKFAILIEPCGGFSLKLPKYQLHYLKNNTVLVGTLFFKLYTFFYIKLIFRLIY